MNEWHFTIAEVLTYSIDKRGGGPRRKERVEEEEKEIGKRKKEKGS